MANVKQVKNEALANIDAAMAILNKFPDLGETNTELSFNTSTNPFTFLMDLFKTTAGYNKLISVIAKFISIGLPAIETSVKALLITKLKEIISCSVNPFIGDEIIRNGIVLNVEEIDITDVLKYSPFDKKVGKYFYFGTEDANFPNDLTKCDDMDAFIWFIINKANRRYVWKPKKNRKDDEFRSNYPFDNPREKLKKEDGIITLEYYERAGSITDAYGNDYYRQTPYNNCLHVFIGDVREKKCEEIENLDALETQLYQNDKLIQSISNKIDNKQYELREFEQEKLSLEERLSNGDINEKEYKKQYKKLNSKINSRKTNIDILTDLRERSYQEKHRFIAEIGKAKAELEDSTDRFFPFLNLKNNRNYYYGKTLIEFNIDYINSLELFDTKSVTARLLDALTGILTINCSFTYKQQLIKNEVNKMVSMITESDDLVVSDCFFTFSNDDYDAMSRQAELRKAGLLTINGDETSAVKVNAEDILSKLNELNQATNKETIQTVIEGAITNISKELSSTTYETNDVANFGVQMNIIENCINSLAYVIVCSILSPKIYILLLINLKLIGRETNFNLEEFIGQYKQLFAEIIRLLRDQLLDFLTTEIMLIIGDLVKEVALKLGIEQARYYTRLIKRLIDCFKKHIRGTDTIDFNVDNVTYADILPSEEEEPKNNEC